MKKEVIYIDIEDDITQVIEKVNSAKSNIIAVVLPKRYPVLQSSVNMKLLKKTSASNSKKVVLVTKDKGLLPLAGDAGIHVAEGLNSRPYIPETEIDDAINQIDAEPELDPGQPIGVLDGDEPNDVDDEADEKDSKSTDDKDKVKKAGFIASLAAGLKTKGVKKVPNFSQSRKKFVLLGVGVVLLIGAWFYLFQVLPSAKIAILAKTSKLPTNLTFSVNPKLDESNIEESKLVGVTEENKLSINEDFTPTGERDIGKKASGTMTVQNCNNNEPETLIPAGTVFLDEATGFRFESTQDVTVPGGTFKFEFGSDPQCESPGEADVPVVSLESGDDKNLGTRTYDIEGYGPGYSGFGSQMTGGTTEIVNFVTQKDVNQAVKKLKDRDHKEQLQELTSGIGEDIFVLGDSFEVDTSDPDVKPAVGEDANSATVTIEFTYSIVGAKFSDIEELLKIKHEDILMSGEQVIQDSGIAEAEVELTENNGVYSVEFDTESYIGPSIDTIKLAEEIANKRYSEAERIIKSKPGVSEVVITPDPWYVYFIPEANKIEISIEVEEAN